MKSILKLSKQSKVFWICVDGYHYIGTKHFIIRTDSPSDSLRQALANCSLFEPWGQAYKNGRHSTVERIKDSFKDSFAGPILARFKASKYGELVSESPLIYQVGKVSLRVFVKPGGGNVFADDKIIQAINEFGRDWEFDGWFLRRLDAESAICAIVAPYNFPNPTFDVRVVDDE